MSPLSTGQRLNKICTFLRSACTTHSNKHYLKASMFSFFQKKKPLKEVMRENKRTINRAVRELDREKVNLEKQEKKIIAEIKKAAKANQMGAVKVSH